MPQTSPLWPLVWTAATAVGTWALVLATWWLVYKQSRISQNELRIRFQVSLEDKFEGGILTAERKALAEQLLSGAAHEEIQEDVMNFFESVGVLLRRGYLDKEMAWVGFGFYAIRWWSACNGYIREERRRQNDDETIFEEFGSFVEAIYAVESTHRGKPRSQLEPGRDEVTSFLESERSLT